MTNTTVELTVRENAFTRFEVAAGSWAGGRGGGQAAAENDRRLWTDVGRVLRHAGYSEDHLPRRTEDHPVVVRRRLPRPDPLTTLIELFVLGDCVSRGEARVAFAPLDLDAVARAELLVATADGVASHVRIDAHGELLFLCDPYPPRRADHVTGVGSVSRALAALTVRTPVERALDVGTGSGVQAVLAARHVRRVTATDVNRRAIAFAPRSTWLNAVEQVVFTEGPLYEPVSNEHFDLVVSNPPFVISPDDTYVFRDGRGEDPTPPVVLGAAERLREGGFATILCNWPRYGDEDWRAWVERWLPGIGCDALVLHYGSDDPLAYATEWNSHLRSEDEVFAAALDRWTAYYDDHGITAVVTAAVILRRRSTGQNWVLADEAPRSPSRSASAHILRVFAAQDFLRALPREESLLDESLALVEPHRLDQVLTFAANRYTPHAAVLTLPEGVGTRVEVEPPALHVVLRLDGERTLAALVEEAARETGIEEAHVRGASLRAARSLLERGVASVGGLERSP